MRDIMYTFSVKIADTVFRLNSLEDHSGFFSAFLSDEEPDYCLGPVTADEISAERDFYMQTYAEEQHLTEPVSDRFCENLLLHGLIAENLLERNTILFHGSALALDGQCYLFAALSGTGKSTHSRLWRESFGSRVVMINDDKPMLHVSPDGVTVYGTPWTGKHRLGINGSAPLKAICLLNRGDENEIHPVDRLEAFPVLYQQSFRSKDPAGLQRCLSLVDALSRSVPLYSLHCNMQPEAALISYEGMNLLWQVPVVLRPI